MYFNQPTCFKIISGVLNVIGTYNVVSPVIILKYHAHAVRTFFFFSLKRNAPWTLDSARATLNGHVTYSARKTCTTF